MPLVSHLPLPAFDELRAAGQDVLSLEQALRQDIRELHVGFLNLMPDSALRSTERQFLRLLGSCNQIAQIYVHPFTIPGLTRGPQAQAYLDSSYQDFAQLRQEGLDALVITGANVANPDLASEPLWDPLQQVIAWAQERVTSILCSCLASHALLKSLYGLERHLLPQKRWGVYRHRWAASQRGSQPHPLLRNINTLFDVPHSRHNQITAQQLESAQLQVLVESFEGEVHLAVSPDGFRFVFLQGHPEYDANSLLKEYKREVELYRSGQRPQPPPFPEHYFDEESQQLAQQMPLPETSLEARLHNTWGDTGKAIFNNWLGLVYRLTHVDRHLPFSEGVDPNHPLQVSTL